uniref:Uncharacterized protein n=2 Tax=Homalodisca liturata TaxID=320908 RepID=A0A1B6JB81_9HEMI
MADSDVANHKTEVQLKKKRSKSTKKSLIAENEKRQKCLEILLKSNSLPQCVVNILKEELKERGQMYKMSMDEMEQFWQELHGYIRELVRQLLDDEGNVGEQICAVVNLLQHTALLHCVGESETFTQMAMVLNLAMTHETCQLQVKNEICKLSEYCCIKELRVPGEFYLNTFNFLFDYTLSEKETEAVDVKLAVKRMWEMHVALARLNLRTQTCEAVVNKLARIVVSPNYLACKEGRQFIAFTFTLDIKLIKKFHQAVKDFLPSCKRNQAVAYGEVYHSAWLNGSAEVRQALGSQCIQNLMTHMFVFPRKKQELTHLGHNVFAILSYLHHNRTLSHFSKTLSELYMPLLWRHLRSGNNIERCNAAEVFLDAYPLETPGSGKVEESNFMNKQHSEMFDLLTDNCHVVRIIAIKGICDKLCSAWRTFPPETIQVLMRNLIDLASDGSDAGVRRALYDGLAVLLLNPESAAYLARILPGLRDCIHDENEKVRKSFVRLLCGVKNMPDPPIKYWKIVTVNHLAARLELENLEVGSELSKLLMSNIYTADQSVDKFLFRLLNFIKISPRAARKLFQFSIKVLDYKNALRVMITILLNLRAHVKKKEAENHCPEQHQEENEVRQSVPKRKKRKSAEVLQSISENDQDGSENKENDRSKENQRNSSSCSSATEDKEEKDEYNQPGVAHALVDIVSLLWSIHSKSLADPSHEEDHNNLMDMACAGIPLFLKYYRGTSTYYAVVHLASFVPPDRLKSVSTVCSACVSHLKQVSEVTPPAELEVVVHALCSWGRFADIQDLVIDWLDQAFRCEGLNQSQVPKEEMKQRRVRFVAKGGKPMVALQLLDTVFGHPLNSTRVLNKSYNMIHDLYIYLERIKVVVERRLLGGLPLDSPMLSDNFLLKCMYRYAILILILHRPEPQTAANDESVVDAFDASVMFYQFLVWTIRVIKPLMPQEIEAEADISVLLIKDILRAAANLVDLMYANEETVMKIAELIQGLLSSECGLWFVESSMIVVKHLKDYTEAKYGAEDKAQLMKKVVPSLLSQALRLLSVKKYTRDQMADYIFLM